LDFETTAFIVLLPFKGYHPYDQVPFQFSSLYIDAKGKEHVTNHLHKSTDDPVPALAEALVEALREPGPIVVYNVGFESRIIEEMAKALPKQRKKLMGLIPRLLDLLPLVRKHVYHPEFHGYFGLKDVYPALCENSNGDYSKLPISSGGEASLAYMESLQPSTPPKRQKQIHNDLIRYCSLDTKATYLVHQSLLAKCP